MTILVSSKFLFLACHNTIIALDQSGGSTPKALKLYGIPDEAYAIGEPSMYDKMHSYRERIMKSPKFNGDRIIGAILFENTLRRTVNDKPTAQYLWDDLEIVPFLKIDEGLMHEHDGVQIMKAMKNLHSLLELAVDHKVFGTKARSLIKHANQKGIKVGFSIKSFFYIMLFPGKRVTLFFSLSSSLFRYDVLHSLSTLITLYKTNVEQQFTIARNVMQHGLHPIIEPEVDIKLDSEEKNLAENMLKTTLLEHLNKLEPNEKVLLKLTLPTTDNLYKECIDHPNVLRVFALSGGYNRMTANELLAKNEKVVASFSRALTEGLHLTDTEEEFDKKLDDSIESIYLASVSGMYE